MEESVGIWQALNQDALEEVASHCSVETLLNLQQTCTSFSQLLANSEKVWFRKLAEDYGLNLKSLPSTDVVFIKLARTVYEAARTQAIRFQGALVTGGVDEDAMQYWVDNMFKPDKASYCSNCSYNADCLALLLDGEVPRDVEYERVRRYMVRRCRYAAALILNVQLPNQDRDPDTMMNILEDWTDAQLESFFRDLVAALNQGHALGRLLVYDVEHERVAAEQLRIQAVEGYLRDRMKAMKAGMLKPPHRPNTMMDSTVVEKIHDPHRSSMAGVVHEVTLSRQGNLTCPVSSGVVLLGSLDYGQLAGLSAEEIAVELEAATQDPVCSSFNFLATAQQVEAAAAAGRVPPIAVTDQTLAGIWHEFEAQPQGRQLSVHGKAERQQGVKQGGVATQTAEQLGRAAAGGPAAPHPPSGAGLLGQAAAAAPSAPPDQPMHGTRDAPMGGSAGTPTAVGSAAAAPASAGVQLEAGAAPASPVVPPTPGPAAAPGALTAAAAAAEAGAPHDAPRPRSLHPPFTGDAPPPGEGSTKGRLIQWRPLVWFHFHKYRECEEFVEAHHSLLSATAPMFSSANVRHRGPPSRQPGSLHLPSLRAQRTAAQPAGRGSLEGRGDGIGGLRDPVAGGSGQPPMGVPHQAQHATQQSSGQPQPPWVVLDQGAGGGGASFAAHSSGLPQALQAQQQQVLLQMGAAPMAAFPPAAVGGLHGGEQLAPGPAPFDAFAFDPDNDLEGSSEGSFSGSGDELHEGGGQGEGAGGEVPGPPGHPAAALAGNLPVVGELQDEDIDAESETEDEEQHAQQVAAFYHALATAAANSGGGGDAMGVPRRRQPLGIVSRRSTRGRNKLHVTLSRPASGNVLLVKLINQENLMHLFQDEHDWPNIDMTYVGLSGKKVMLPQGLWLQS